MPEGLAVRVTDERKVDVSDIVSKLGGEACGCV
jgi:hypothetical protein